MNVTEEKPAVRSFAVAVRPDGRMSRRPFLVETLEEAERLKARGSFLLVGPDPGDSRDLLAWRSRNPDLVDEDGA